MPFPYPTSSASVRTRRTKEKDKEKDKDSRGVASSSSGRRHREVSKSSKGTESKALSTSPLSLYSQHNITLDQLPALPESGTESPSSAASPVYPSSPYLTNAVHRPQSSVYPHTPAALQPYLDDESDEPTVVWSFRSGSHSLFRWNRFAPTTTSICHRRGCPSCYYSATEARPECLASVIVTTLVIKAFSVLLAPSFSCFTHSASASSSVSELSGASRSLSGHIAIS